MKTCTKCGETKEQDQFRKHRNACKKCCRVAGKKYQTPEQKFKWAIKTKYDLSLEQYEQMLIDQNNQCYICNAEEKLVIDHCHESGKVRGLLCNHCNLVLGHAKDNPALLRLAANYLERAE